MAALAAYLLKTSACDLTRAYNIKHKYGRVPSHRASQRLSRAWSGRKLRGASYDGIAVRFYEILRYNTEPQGIPDALAGMVR